jgi:hypothetical protein
LLQLLYSQLIPLMFSIEIVKKSFRIFTLLSGEIGFLGINFLVFFGIYGVIYLAIFH